MRARVIACQRCCSVDEQTVTVGVADVIEFTEGVISNTAIRNERIGLPFEVNVRALAILDYLLLDLCLVSNVAVPIPDSPVIQSLEWAVRSQLRG